MSELTEPQLQALQGMASGGADEGWELSSDELGDLMDRGLVRTEITITDRGREVLADA